MKERHRKLAEHFRGSCIYQLLHLKGHRSRFVITRQDVGGDQRTHNLITKLTINEIIPHWEKLCEDNDGRYDEERFQLV